MIKTSFKKLVACYMVVGSGLILLIAFVTGFVTNIGDLLFAISFIIPGLIMATIPLAMLSMIVVTLAAVVSALFRPKQAKSKKQQRQTALKLHVQKAGGSNIYVKRIGPVGKFLEHFFVNYRDSEGQWQVRHVIRNQIQDQFYWDDPVVAYEREVSAEISQSKQQLINDLDVEIHNLQHAIHATVKEKPLAEQQNLQ